MDRFSLKSVVSSVALTALALTPLFAPIQTFAAIDPNEVDVSMQGFSISSPYMTVAGQPTAPGSFSNGNVGQYAEGSCVPVLMRVTNASNPAETGDLSYRLIYDYQSNGQNTIHGIERFESIVTGLTDPGTADNLNDFTYGNSELTVASSFSNSNGGNTSALITGPYSGSAAGIQPILSSDTERHYNITLSNVAPNVTVYVTACARLSRDAGQFPGASMHTSAGNGNGGGGGQVPIPANDLLILPTLNVTKQIDGGTANPSNWTFNVSPAINGVSNFTIAPGESTYTFTNVEPGVYSITEPNGPANYTFTGTSGDCSFSTGAASTTLVATTNGQIANCTLVNTFTQPAPQTGTITVNKVVVNDNGGTLDANTVPLFVNAQPVTNGVATTVNIGTYLISETNPSGYTASFSGDCDANGNLTVGAGQNLTCTITNDDDFVPSSPGFLTVIKQVVEPACDPEDAGCTSNAPGDFMLSVYSSTTPVAFVQGTDAGFGVDLNPGAYSVVEEADQNDPNVLQNFITTYSEDCSGIMEDDGVKTCIVTNTRIPDAPAPATLTLNKVVINDNGGTAVVSDFPLTLLNWITGTITPVVSGDTLTLTSGLYRFLESTSNLYTNAYTGDCSDANNPVPGGPFPDDGRGFVLIQQGDQKTCTLTNDDIPTATTSTAVTFIIHVINDDGGTGTASDIEILPRIDGSVITSFPGDEAGTTVNLPAGLLSFSDGVPAGYIITDASEECGGQLLDGEQRVCTVTYTDVPSDPETGTLTIIKHVINDDGGTAKASDFTLTLSTLQGDQSVQGSENGVVLTVDPTEYTVTEPNPSGYTVSYSPECSGTISGGQTKTCTVTNNDIQDTSEHLTATIIVQTVVINNDGGWRTAADFQQSISATNASVTNFSGSSTGIAITVDPGAYSVSEVDPALYTKSLSANCSGTISAGQTITCVITNDDFAQSGGGGTITIGGGGGGGSSSGGGSTPSTGGSTPTPPGEVLGAVDEESPAVTPVVTDPGTPAPTTGATELPRTGLPLGILLLSLLPAAGVALQRKER